MRVTWAIGIVLAIGMFGASDTSIAAPRPEGLHGGRACQHGYVQRSPGECVCPAGDQVIDKECVGPNHCPPGWDNSNGQCRPSTSCPTGEQLIHGHCVGPGGCPPGGVLVEGAHRRCEAKPSCPNGYRLEGSECVAPVSGGAASGGPSPPLRLKTGNRPT